MDITIIGTGKMALGIATRMLSGGNNVTFIGRNKQEADQLTQKIGSSASRGATARSEKMGDPVVGDVVVLAVPYTAAHQVIRDYKNQLSGKILIDITNPLNQSYDGLSTPPNSSAAEEIAKELGSNTRVVKAFNTTFAATLQKGEVAGQPLDVFIASDDTNAKKTVMGLVEAGKMRPIDAGPLKIARQLEHMALLEIMLQGPMGTNFMSSIKILS